MSDNVFDIELQKIEKKRKDCIEMVRQRDISLKLYDIPEFKELIIQEYMHNEPARLAIIAQDPNFDDKQQRDCQNMAFAPGHLKRWLSMIVVRGNNAQHTLDGISAEIEDVEEARELARQEAEAEAAEKAQE